MLKYTHALQVLRDGLTIVCEGRGSNFADVLAQSLELLPLDQSDLAKEFETALDCFPLGKGTGDSVSLSAQGNR